MSEQGVRSNYSLCPFEIEMCDDQGGISSATGFIYDQNGELFLITNWHNVAGKDPFTGEPVLDQAVGRFPTYIKAKLASVVNPPHTSSDVIAAFVAQRIDIYEDYAPRWFEHPILGHQCDVVALPLERRPNDRPDGFHKAVNLMDPARIPVLPGGTVYVIGFPHAISVGPGLPIWKSGYIASEPQFRCHDRRPKERCRRFRGWYPFAGILYRCPNAAWNVRIAGLCIIHRDLGFFRALRWIGFRGTEILSIPMLHLLDQPQWNSWVATVPV